MAGRRSSKDASPLPEAIGLNQSPLDVVERAFKWLAVGPSPLSLDGASVGHGLPARAIPVDELGSILVHPSTSCHARDAVWRLLVLRARARGVEGKSWTVVAAGCALRDLRRTARRLRGDWEANAEILKQFVVALRRVDLVPAKVFYRLMNIAQVEARAALRADSPGESGVSMFMPGSSVPPPRLFGHPDFVLARAVKRGVITEGEADMIARMRLEKVTAKTYALTLGVSPWSVYKYLAAAEERLVKAIQSGALSDPESEVILDATTTVKPDPWDWRSLA